ncbi:uncharacterized protein LOC124157097 isoform X2 [Ischnura elegans]|uniref:uncharacterized protein LOC124157097 isoform X2 n=1 Tax=Ischnura elegans TaxID=197161 RepID=UPI001ED86CBD|nr:uncharacterized protein LOC124157097 isoform X2 [Ischnura elegans]
MPWVVVKFHALRDGDSRAFTTIPSSWVTKVGNKNYALYPPGKVSESEVKRLIYKGEDPNDDWDLLYLKYVTPSFDSVIEALEFECKAADQSEIDLEVFAKTGTIGKRKRKAKDIRYPNEPVSSEDEDAVEVKDPLSTTASMKEGNSVSLNSQSSPKNITNGGSLSAPAVKILVDRGKTVRVMQQTGKILVKETENQASSGAWSSSMLIPKPSGNAKDLIKVIPVHKLDEPRASSSGLHGTMLLPKMFNDANRKVKVIPVHKLDELKANMSGIQSKMPVPKLSTNANVNGGIKIVSVQKVLSPNSLQDMVNVPVSRISDDFSVKDPGNVGAALKVPTSSSSLQSSPIIAKNCDDLIWNGKLISIRRGSDIQGSPRSLLRNVGVTEKSEKNSTNGTLGKIISVRTVSGIQGSSRSLLKSNAAVGKCDESMMDKIEVFSEEEVNDSQATTSQSNTSVLEEYNDYNLEAMPDFEDNESSSSRYEGNIPEPEQCDDVDMMDSSTCKENLDEVTASTTTLPNTEDVTKKSDDADVKDLIKNFERKVTKQMASILDKISLLEEGMMSLSDKIDGRKFSSEPPEDFSDCEELLVLPVDSLEDLFFLQEEISTSPKYKRFMMKKLKDHSASLVFKGLRMKAVFHSLNRTVYSCLATIMTNRVGMMLCRKGKSLNKVSFELNFPQLISLIHDVVRAKQVNGPEINTILLARSIGEWFRQARLRQNNSRQVISFQSRESDVKMEGDNEIIL